MDRRPFSSRRLLAAAVLACAAALAPLSALAASSSSAAPPACETPQLVVWLDTQGDGTAGSIYYKLRFTNLSGHACTLNGYPYIHAVSLGGTNLGAVASFDHSHAPASITIPKGSDATAVLRIVEAGNFPAASCRPVTAAGLRVYPPNQTRAKVVPFPFEACSHTGPAYLVVGPVT
jgi:hypothetical protein